MRLFALCCLLLAGLVSAEDRKSYRGHQVISLKAANQEQINTLTQLQEDNLDLIFLGDPSLVMETEIVVPPSRMAEVLKVLKAAEFAVRLLSVDVQAEIDEVMAENYANKLRNRQAQTLDGRYSPPHNVYYQKDEVDNILANFANAYPNLVSRKPLPYKSALGRDIYYIELGTADANKPVIFLEGLAHAREWIVTASLIYAIDTMVSGYQAGDQQAVTALNKYTWVIIPIVNPDGYIYTWTTDRMWRKNRKSVSSLCTGVDLNRNYDVDFGKVGASTNCLSDTYHGGKAFSEPETQNVAALFNQLKSRVVSFLSVHSYSQLLLYPWGYVNSNVDPSPPSNLAALRSVGTQMRTALAINGRNYLLGTAYSVLGYAASGASEDWALQEKAGIYAYCYELRPATASQGGFNIPASQIIPTGQEFLASLYVLSQNI